MGIQMGWFRPEHQHDPKKKEQFEQAIRNSTVLIERLLEILDTQEEILNSTESNPDNYNGDWLAKQSFFNGVRSNIRNLRKLLTIT